MICVIYVHLIINVIVYFFTSGIINFNGKVEQKSTYFSPENGTSTFSILSFY